MDQLCAAFGTRARLPPTDYYKDHTVAYSVIEAALVMTQILIGDTILVGHRK
jgi:hypothetical protein